MTETEWLTCDDPEKLLDSLVTTGARKRRLFACACCLRLGGLLTTIGANALDVAERFADGKATREELIAIRLLGEYGCTLDVRIAVSHAVALEEYPADLRPAHRWAAVAGTDAPAEWKAQSELLRDIFGNPFRPITLNPAWLTSTVKFLARGIYDERAFDQMPILADALQDAGCANDDILNHCRDPKATHVRGCWALDLVLGKT